MTCTIPLENECLGQGVVMSNKKWHCTPRPDTDMEYPRSHAYAAIYDTCNPHTVIITSDYPRRSILNNLEALCVYKHINACVRARVRECLSAVLRRACKWQKLINPGPTLPSTLAMFNVYLLRRILLCALFMSEFYCIMIYPPLKS